MARHRTANEKKVLDVLMTNVGDFSWNKGTFAALLAYEHPVIQQKIFETIMEVVDSLATNYVMGAFTAENADACEMAYTIKMALESDERFRMEQEPIATQFLE